MQFQYFILYKYEYSEEYYISPHELIIFNPPISKFELKLISQIDPFINTSLETKRTFLPVA